MLAENLMVAQDGAAFVVTNNKRIGTMNKNRFFPSDKYFWLYHSAGLFALASIDSLTIFLAPHTAGFKLWSAWVIWPLLFTFAVLLFRWLYRRHASYLQKPPTQLIPVIVVYAGVASALAAAVITLILLPTYWTAFVPLEAVSNEQLNLTRLGFQIAIGTALSGQLFIMAWIFIYVSIVQSRQAREQELQNAQLQGSLKEAQLATLNSQLNPHFLFNALNNIRFVIYEDVQNADRMITVLSELLRYTLNSSRQTLVPLEQELAMAQKFIDLIKLQYEDKLRYSVTNTLSNPPYYAPPLSIQTLVENAVKHGLEFLPQGGEISIDLSDVSRLDACQIIISNTIPAQPANSNRQNTGTGQNNLRHRIALLFGEGAKLETYECDGLYQAKLILPRGINP